MANVNIEKNPIRSPLNISFNGWKTILFRIKDEVTEDNVTIISAGVAFYIFLAIFPALMALISIYGLAVNPQQIESQLSQLALMMPEQAFEIIQAQIESLTSTPGETLSWGMVAGILFSLWSANKGTKSLFEGINIAYETKDLRGFFKQNGLTLLFTLGSVILIILCMALIVAFPAFVDYLGLPNQIEGLISWLRWVVLAIIVIFFLCLIYKFAPARQNQRLKWVIVGAVISTFLWLLASWGFSFYVSNFGNYGEIYGSISAVVVLMLWLFITCFIILLGAEINSEMKNYAEEGHH